MWNFNDRIDAEVCAEGVERKILAYTDELMCVENHFKKGAVGALHHHPHTQITYVVSGSFEFEIDGVRRVIKPGDALLKRNDIEHGCVCLEDGILLDIFLPRCGRSLYKTNPAGTNLSCRLCLYIVETGIIAVGNDAVADLLKLVKPVDHLASEEGGSVFECRFVDNHGSPLALMRFMTPWILLCRKLSELDFIVGGRRRW